MATENDVIAFYTGCDYQQFREGSPYRPSEMHVPHFISIQKKEVITELISHAKDGRIQAPLDEESCQAFAAVLLHESLFHYYKCFYNYLAARALFSGGMLHWIDITLYYARFYLARSVTTLLGHQSYAVRRFDGEPISFGTDTLFNSSNRDFNEDIAKALQGQAKLQPDKYKVRLDIDMHLRHGMLIFDKKDVSSHIDVWNDYSNLDVENLGLFNLAYISKDHLRNERNRENYSFDGYTQLDINVGIESFKQQFGLEYVSQYSDQIYDQISGDVLTAFSTQMQLYKSLNIAELPIEKEKFAYMIQHCLPETRAKEKLLTLCEEGFPTKILSSADGTIFCDQRGECL